MNFDKRWVVAATLVAAVGAINWGLVGALDVNIVTLLLGTLGHEVVSAVSRAIYLIIGVAGIVVVAMQVFLSMKVRPVSGPRYQR